MADAFFTRTTISGKQKAALLCTMLGSPVANTLLPYMSETERNILRKVVKKFSKTTEKKGRNIADDIIVLEEVMRFGKAYNILPKNVKKHDKNLASNINANASDVAKILSLWLSEGK